MCSFDEAIRSVTERPPRELENQTNTQTWAAAEVLDSLNCFILFNSFVCLCVCLVLICYVLFSLWCSLLRFLFCYLFIHFVCFVYFVCFVLLLFCVFVCFADLAVSLSID